MLPQLGQYAFLFLYVCMCRQVGRSKISLQEVLSFHLYAGSRDQTQVLSLDSQLPGPIRNTLMYRLKIETNVNKSMMSYSIFT